MRYQLEPTLNTQSAQQLYQMLARIDDAGEVAALLRDLLTVEEIEEAARRFEVAGMLSDGKTFRDIAATAKTSTATVARVTP